MRAGLLSDPRVIALLREHFIPCHVSALNTTDCMTDPRDAETLGRYGEGNRTFLGGEREAFLLPDGTMMDVFLSLHGTDRNDGRGHKDAEGRRSEYVLIPFRENAERALRAADGELPADWDAVWSGDSETVVAIAREAPRWPAPEPGTAALRVFVRNSYRMYDDLHGCELVALPADFPDWAEALRKPGDAVSLPEPLFLALARAMVPRGQVDTRLHDDSIRGGLRLRATAVTDGVVRGVVEGEFALEPGDRSEVGRRANAACLFHSRGVLRGEFAFDPSTGTFETLRFVADEVDFAWKPRFQPQPDEFPPVHRIAVEQVATDAQAR